MTPPGGYRIAVAGRNCTLFVAILLVILAALPSAMAQGDIEPIAQGTGGPPTIANPPPLAGSSDALANVDLSTGFARASLPFILPTARGKAQSSLALVYNSSSGTGFAGVGWTLDLPSIERKGASGFPKFEDDVSGTDLAADTYIFAGNPLVPICTIGTGGICDRSPNTEHFPDSLTGWTYFRMEIDGGMRFFWSPNRDTWLAQTKSGLQLYFGVPPDNFGNPGLERADALFRDGHTTDIFRWNLVRESDAFRNTVYYFWKNLQTAPAADVSGIQYLTDIYDTPPIRSPRLDLDLFAHQVHLRWSAPDASLPILAQSPIWRTQPALRLIGVDITSKLMSGEGPRQLVRRYHLSYTWNSTNTRAFLSSLQLEGTCHHYSEDAQNALPDVTNCDTLPAITLNYTSPSFSANVLEARFGQGDSTFESNDIQGAVSFVDVYGSGIPELLFDAEPAAYIERVLCNPFDRRCLPGVLAYVESRAGTGIKRIAKLSDITAGAKRTAVGDWIGDGRENVLWLDIDPANPQASRNKYETYSLIQDLTHAFIENWNGQGPFDLPNTGPNVAIQPDWQKGRAMDTDGDGLTDMAFVPDSPVQGQSEMRAYFSERDSTGVIKPFAQKGVATCVPFGINPGTYRNTTTRTVADMDGDGLADIVVIENTSDSGPSTFANLTAHYFKNRGDGRFGVATSNGAQCENLANVSVDIYNDMPGIGQELDAIIRSSSIALHDIDGDGIADLVSISKNGVFACLQTRDQHPGYIGLPVFGKCVSVDAQAMGWSAENVRQFDPQKVALLFADVEGSGVDDLVVVAFGRSILINFTGGTRPGLLNKISNGRGIETTIEYDSGVHLDKAAASANQEWRTKLPVPTQLVTKITTSNNLTALSANYQAYETDYSYRDPIYDARDREFLGFRTVTTRQLGGGGPEGDEPGLVTLYTFVTDTCPNVAPATPCPPVVDYWYRMRRGLPAVVEQREDSPSHPALSTTVNTYTFRTLYEGIDGHVVRTIWPSQTDLYLWDPAQQQTQEKKVAVMRAPEGDEQNETITVDLPRINKHLIRTSRRDEFANEYAAVEFGESGVDTPILIRRDWGLPNGDPTGWNYRVFRQRISYADKTGQLPTAPVRETDFDYDWRGLLTKISAPLEGTLKLERHNDGHAVAPPPADASADTALGSPLLLLSASYDFAGNLTQTQAPNGRCATIEYDHPYSQLPILNSVYRGSCGNDPLSTQHDFDRGLEKVTMELNWARQMSTVKYDGFGRLIELDQPDDASANQIDSSPAVIVDYSFSSTDDIYKVHLRQIAGPKQHPTYAESWTSIDGFGHTLFTVRQTELTQKWIVEGANTRSSNGRITALISPFFFDGTTGASFSSNMGFGGKATLFKHDALGRVLETRTPDGSATDFVYHLHRSPSTLLILSNRPADYMLGLSRLRLPTATAGLVRPLTIWRLIRKTTSRRWQRIWLVAS